MADKEYNRLEENGLLFLLQSLKQKVAAMLPTKTSELTNDSNYVADSNYVHTDNNLTTELKSKWNTAAERTIPGATSTVPKMDGTAAIGTETAFAKGDHVHPTDTSRAPLASPALTGTPTAPTAAAGNNTTQIATTAFVQTEIASKVSATYKPAGSVTFANLPAAAAAVLGNVYNVTDAFTTDATFVEGAGKSYPAGTNVAIIQKDSAYYHDALAGFVDLSGCVKATEMKALTNAEIEDIVDEAFGS